MYNWTALNTKNQRWGLCLWMYSSIGLLGNFSPSSILIFHLLQRRSISFLGRCTVVHESHHAVHSVDYFLFSTFFVCHSNKGHTSNKECFHVFWGLIRQYSPRTPAHTGFIHIPRMVYFKSHNETCVTVGHHIFFLFTWRHLIDSEALEVNEWRQVKWHLKKTLAARAGFWSSGAVRGYLQQRCVLT